MAHAWNACWVHALGGSNPPSSASRSHRPLDETGFLYAHNVYALKRQPRPTPAMGPGRAGPVLLVLGTLLGYTGELGPVVPAVDTVRHKA